VLSLVACSHLGRVAVVRDGWGSQGGDPIAPVSRRGDGLIPLFLLGGRAWLLPTLHRAGAGSGRGDARRDCKRRGWRGLTLAPIWLPHWPAWMCTISLMLAASGWRLRNERGLRAAESGQPPAARSYSRSLAPAG
jgi:hypothetical protein